MTDSIKQSSRPKRYARQPAEVGAPGDETPNADHEDTPAPAPARVNNTELVLALLRRDEGPTLTEIVEATGWLPHSARAALTGLRKKGHIIEKGKRGDVTCYSISESAE